jgi:4-hydroxy-tetrahydrodipicolinate reductase
MMQARAKTRVVVVGAGPIGAAVAHEVGARRDLELVAVVDVDADKHGRHVAGVAVTGSVMGVDADVAVVCTTSSFPALLPTLRACLARGWHVVSTCEELVWPWLHHGALARSLDEEAVAAGRAVVGTGVNPGFLMDALPVFCTAICARVDAITVLRAQDAATRRKPFQDKIGVGLSIDEFNARVAGGGFLHRGLGESAALLAHALGLSAPAIDESHAPVVDGGVVKGVRQLCRVSVDARVKIELRFEAWAGHDAARDEIVVDGDPPLRIVTTGAHGDVATRAIAVNAIAAVQSARPGLRTALDLPLVSARF